MTSWYDKAREVIQTLDESMPADLPIEERKKAVFDAYPFVQRRYFPYRMWCKAQKEYLARYQKSDAAIPEKHLSPLERMMKRAGA